jgi:hypothetical protein
MAAESQQSVGSGRELPGAVVEDILESDRRRTMLSCLSDHGGEMAVTDLAACVCAREQGTSVDDAPDADTETLYDDLYDEHLPKLTATGVVAFDSLRGCVALQENSSLGTASR